MLDLKTTYRGWKYLETMIELLPEKPDPEVLRESGELPHGHVVAVQSQPGPQAVSLIIPLQVRYSEDAPSAAP